MFLVVCSNGFATDDEKHYQCQNIVLNNNTEELFLEFNW